MGTQYRRREFLTMSATASAGMALGTLNALTPPCSGSAAPAQPITPLIPVHPDMLPLIQLIEQTPPERIAPVFIERCRKGLDGRRLFTASFLHAIRQHDSGHHVYMGHAVRAMWSAMDPPRRFLPLFWQLATMKFEESKFRPQSPPPRPISDDHLPSPSSAREVLPTRPGPHRPKPPSAGKLQ